ncbi:hypothetical protein WOA01_11825 [Methylocystis sp. IM2]
MVARLRGGQSGKAETGQEDEVRGAMEPHERNPLADLSVWQPEGLQFVQ